MKWEKVKLSEVTEYITDGDHQPAPKSDSGVLFVKIKDIQDNRLTFDNALFVPQEYYNRLPKNRKAEYGDTLYTVVGSYGIPAFVNHNIPFCFERNIALLHPNNRVIPKYLYYAVNNPIFYGNANNIANGSAQKLIPLSKLAGMEISVPPIERQETIVNILSAYDDLIENNQKQIKLLEEAAQRLYKEWFIDLRFPGHETTPIVDGIPEGWEVCKFSEIASIMSGGTPKTEVKEYYEGDIPFYTPKDSDGSFFVFDTITHISEAGLEHCNSQYYPEGTVIITARGTVGKTTILAVPMAMNQSCYALKCDELNSPYYLFFSLNKEVDSLKTMANGGVFNTIIVKTFDSISLTIPTQKVLSAFNAVVSSIMQQIKAKMKQNIHLAEARDRLLPKLMSGELEV